jgi:hypothetical protein
VFKLDYYENKKNFFVQLEKIIINSGKNGTDLKFLSFLAMKSKGYGWKVVKEYCDNLVNYAFFKYDATEETIYPPENDTKPT